MVLPKADLITGLESNTLVELTINCQINGTYDKNIADYTCTKPCPFPSLPDPQIMIHDWTNNETKPEIGQTVRLVRTFKISNILILNLFISQTFLS
jgi:hypothetical protein